MTVLKRIWAAGLCLILASLPILSAVKAEDGPPPHIPPPPGPITLNIESIEQTLYLYGNNKQSLVWPVEVTSDISAYGSASWELIHEAGDAVALYLTDQGETSCSLRYRDITSFGSVSYMLTCRVDRYAASIPVHIEVSDASVPDTILAAQQVYTAAAGERIAIPRPDLLPLSTDVPAEAFEFELIIRRGAEGGVTRPETSDEMRICQFEVPGYYQGSIWMHNFSNISFRHNLLFIITDAAGAIPGSPQQLLPAAIEETVYLNGNAEGFRLGKCELLDARYALSPPVWSITPETGDAMTVEIGNQTEETCEVLLSGMSHEGDAAFSLNCALGEYIASIPAIFHVSAVSVPTSMTVASNVYRAVAGDTISVSRPELLPVGTGLSPDAFSFMVALQPDVLSAALVSKGPDAIGLRFIQPGYYQGKIVMQEGNVVFSDNVMFIISDASGTVTGTPLQLDKSMVEATVYLDGSMENAVISQVRLLSGLDKDTWQLPAVYFGEPVWSLSDIGGDAMTLRVEAGPPDECRLIAASLSHTGDVTGTLRCDSGGFNASVPVLIHVVDEALPERMEAMDLYNATVGQEITIPRPNLLPEGTVPTENNFTPGLSGDAAFESAAAWQPTKEGGIVLSFSAPGMYVATLSMSHSNVHITRDVRFDIIPAPVLTLDSVTLSARGIPLGSSVTATALAAGASGDILYAFRAYRDGSATGIHQPFGPSNSFLFLPEEEGLYTIQAAAYDRRNLVSAFSPSIAVDYSALLELRVSRNRITTGEQAEVTSSALRGSGEYSFAFQAFKDGVMLNTPGMSQDFSPKSIFRFIPTLRGSYIVRVTLDDGISQIWQDSSPITVSSPVLRVTTSPRKVTIAPVTPAPVTLRPVIVTPVITEPIQLITPLVIIWPLALNAQANTAYTATGHAVSVKAQASGGTGSYEFSFQVYLNNATIGSATSFSTKNTFSFTPKKPGNYKVLVKVRDGQSKASVYTGNINVK